jgi:TRAP-type C4-dicarboxylate transport system permease small subunit
MRKHLNTLFDWAGYAAGVCIFLIFALMIFASIGRELNMRVGGVNDLVAWLCAAGSFLAMAHAFKNGDFVRVTLGLEKASKGLRRFFELSSLIIATLAVGYLAFWACKFTYESYVFQEYSNGLIAIPIWIPQMSFVVGAVLLFLAVLDELYIVLKGERPTYVTRVEERHARGDFSGEV